jgi:hypothetical protein
MEYYKLIALEIGDFSSTIFFEDNFGLEELEEAKAQKEELEHKGYVCLLAKTVSGLRF